MIISKIAYLLSLIINIEYSYIIDALLFTQHIYITRKSNLPLMWLRGGCLLMRRYKKCALSLLIIGVMVIRFAEDCISLLEIGFFSAEYH